MATGNILGFVNMKWTIVYKVRRVHVAPYGPTHTCVHIIGELKKMSVINLFRQTHTKPVL